MFRYDSRLFQALNKFYDLLFLSVLWCLCSITVIGAGPATTALYYAVVKAVRRQRGYPGREFLHAFRDNFKKSVLAQVILSAFGGILLITDIPFAAEWLAGTRRPEPWIFFLLAAKVFLLAGLSLYTFPVFSRFEAGIRKGIAFSGILIFRHFLSSVLMMTIMTATLVLVWLEPLLLLVLPGISVFLCSFPMEWILEQYMLEEEKETDLSRDQWYLEK